jgi:hypothetical protein
MSPTRPDPPHEYKPWEKRPSPMTLARAQAFTMPFGKYKGKALAEIQAADPGYLRWLATDCSARAVRRAAAYLTREQEPRP